MASNCWLFLLLQAFSAIFSKYVYVEKRKSWEDAQNHCRNEFTDLAPLSNMYDTYLLFELNSKAINHTSFWIGLMQEPTNEAQWFWSGGGEVNWTSWSNYEPNDYGGNEDHGELYADLRWNDLDGRIPHTFFCYNVHVVRERKTWEEALKHCRTHHRDLASVASDTELMLMRREMSRQAVSENVWIGMRFLAEEWLWSDRQPLEYEAWGPGGKPTCPMIQRCAALEITGTLISSTGIQLVSNIADVKEWRAKSCDEKLHFLCY